MDNECIVLECNAQPAIVREDIYADGVIQIVSGSHVFVVASTFDPHGWLMFYVHTQDKPISPETDTYEVYAPVVDFAPDA